MAFDRTTYEGFVADDSAAQRRVFAQYQGADDRFDVVIIGSGMGGGLLADALADRFGEGKRILLLEAGSFLFPTHVYNCFKLPNADVAQRFACRTFWQGVDPERYIHERPQLNFGGRSIFWSGLIPTVQDWELEFFPDGVRADLKNGLLAEAGETMNQSRTLGPVAKAVVERLRLTGLGDDFVIEETPRALHQPYLKPDGTPSGRFFVEPTGVFNVAELLLNQLGLAGGTEPVGGLHLLLDHFMEDVQADPGGGYRLIATPTLGGGVRQFRAGTVVLACGSIESPKLLRRASSLFGALPDEVRGLVGRGLTDHPTSHWIGTAATKIGDVDLPRDSHAKVVLYSKGRRDAQGAIAFPFNVEMNLNHEYWHLRNDDPSEPSPAAGTGASSVEIKFSFGNCLDDGNEVRSPEPFGYVPEVSFRNLSWTSHLVGSRFPALAGWQKTDREIFDVMNGVADRIFGAFEFQGGPCAPAGRYGENDRGFGLGTVHHAVGTLRMPRRPHLNAPVSGSSVFDENLQVRGAPGLYVCDMSVMPFSSAANPVRTLAALALRLSRHLT